MKRTVTILLFGFFLFSQGVRAADTDSVTIWKNNAASDIREFENMPAALKIISKLFGDKLKHSTKAINKVLAVNPTDTEALFLRAIVLRLDGKFNEAEAEFKKIVSQDDRYVAFDFPNVWLQLGYTYRDKNEYDLAIDAFKQGALINLHDTWPLIELSFVFIDLNRPEEASEAFYGGLNEVKNPRKVDLLFYDVQDIATTGETKRWKDSLKTIDEKLEFIKIFWKRRDPNPIDPVNQRLIEHYKRLTYVRRSYSKPFPPYYDDRGAVYLNLGKPERVYFGKPRENINENESWIYDNIKAGLFIDFVEFNGIYEMRPLLDAAQPSARTEELYQLFEERSTLNPYYQRMAQKIHTQQIVEQDRVNETLQMAGGIARPDLIDLANRMNRVQQAANMLNTNPYNQDNLGNLSYANRQNFVFDAGAQHLPMNCNFASFRSAERKSRLEFYYLIPFANMAFIPNITQTGKMTSSLKIRFKLFDLKYNDVALYENEFDVTANTSELQSHFFLDQVDQPMAPGKYVAAVELRNNEKDRVGIYQFVVNVRDYSADTLQVSDIEIAQYVDQTLTKEKYIKPQSNLKVVPNPAAGVLKSKPLTVYYEVYNLTPGEEGRTSYQISYAIKMVDSDKNFLVKLFSSGKEASTSSVTVKEGRSKMEREYIGFDISEMPAGVANLEIKVKDLVTGKESLSWTNFTILDPKKEETSTAEKPGK